MQYNCSFSIPPSLCAYIQRILNNSYILLCFHVVETLPATPDDDDNSNGIHVFYRRENVMADRGEPFVVINVVAPADANELDSVIYNLLNGLTPGLEFQGLYHISNIQSGGVATAIYGDLDTNNMITTIGVLITTIELFGKTLCVLYNPTGCSTQCSIDLFTCYSCYLPHVFVDYYIQTLFHATHVHIVH